MDAFDLDDLIHRYARELWNFCGSVTGSRAGSIARSLEDMQERGETIDWWEPPPSEVWLSPSSITRQPCLRGCRSRSRRFKTRG